MEPSYYSHSNDYQTPTEEEEQLADSVSDNSNSHKSDAEFGGQLANRCISDNWESVCRIFQCPKSTMSMYILVHLYDFRDKRKGDICSTHLYIGTPRKSDQRVEFFLLKNQNQGF